MASEIHVCCETVYLYCLYRNISVAQANIGGHTPKKCLSRLVKPLLRTERFWVLYCLKGRKKIQVRKSRKLHWNSPTKQLVSAQNLVSTFLDCILWCSESDEIDSQRLYICIREIYVFPITKMLIIFVRETEIILEIQNKKSSSP